MVITSQYFPNFKNKVNSYENEGEKCVRKGFLLNPTVNLYRVSKTTISKSDSSAFLLWGYLKWKVYVLYETPTLRCIRDVQILEIPDVKSIMADKINGFLLNLVHEVFHIGDQYSDIYLKVKVYQIWLKTVFGKSWFLFFLSYKKNETGYLNSGGQFCFNSSISYKCTVRCEQNSVFSLCLFVKILISDS